MGVEMEQANMLRKGSTILSMQKLFTLTIGGAAVF
jgi:hypothetical protein